MTHFHAPSLPPSPPPSPPSAPSLFSPTSPPSLPLPLPPFCNTTVPLDGNVGGACVAAQIGGASLGLREGFEPTPGGGVPESRTSPPAGRLSRTRGRELRVILPTRQQAPSPWPPGRWRWHPDPLITGHGLPMSWSVSLEPPSRVGGGYHINRCMVASVLPIEGGVVVCRGDCRGGPGCLGICAECET